MQIFDESQKQQLFETFNSNPSGAFIAIKGYESISGGGEVANFILQSGIHYANIKTNSVKRLEEIKAGKVVPSVHVKCSTWQNPDGTYSNRKSKERKLVDFEQDYDFGHPEFQRACDEIMEGLVAPKSVEQPYEKEANGIYSVDGDALYIRECLVVRKDVVKFGVREHSATHPFTALKNAVRKLLPVDNYRTFKLDGRFEKIAVNHTEISVLPW
jgi:hypothetical protein